MFRARIALARPPQPPPQTLALSVFSSLSTLCFSLVFSKHGSLVSPSARNAFDRTLPRYAGGKNSMCNCGNVTSGCDVGLRDDMSGQSCFWVGSTLVPHSQLEGPALPLPPPRPPGRSPPPPELLVAAVQFSQGCFIGCATCDNKSIQPDGMDPRAPENNSCVRVRAGTMTTNGASDDPHAP